MRIFTSYLLTLKKLIMKVFTAKLSMTVINSFTGRANGSTVALINDRGEYGFLAGEDTPYTPIGGRKALVNVFSAGAITFKPYSFGNVAVKIGRAVKKIAV